MIRRALVIAVLVFAALQAGCNSDQRQLLDRAEARWREGNYDDAIRLYTLLYDREHQGKFAAKALLSLGNIHYLNRREPGIAVEFYSKLVEELPGRPEEYVARLQLERIYEYELGDLTQAIIQYDKLLEMKNLQDREKFLRERANLYFKKQDYHRALREFQRLEEEGLHDHPAHPVYLKIGNIYQIQHNYEEAIPYFEKLAAAGCIECRRQGIIELERTYESLYDFEKAVAAIRRLDPTPENKDFVESEVRRLLEKHRRVDSGEMTWRTHP